VITSRRIFLARLTGAGSAAVGAICSPSVAAAHARRISQVELDGAIVQHAIWLEDRSQGTRAAFPNCDLSNLDFHSERDTLVNLRGADFTAADLSGVTGNLISFRRASLHYARLSHSRFVEPAFIDASLRGAICQNVVWGWSLRPSAGITVAESDLSAVMFNCDAGEADFGRARVRGHFLETNFVAASLVDADFSRSTFAGTHLHETSFFRADLTRARFGHAEIAYARFSQATLAGTDFRRARIGPRVKFPEEFFRQAITTKGDSGEVST
jgi:uncharacterized protein YjbI with pentapeptide repeats